MIYIVSIIASFLAIHCHNGTRSWGIAFSLFVVGIASFSQRILISLKEVTLSSPKELEWRAAFGLMVTLIWLYVEILRLLAIIAASR